VRGQRPKPVEDSQNLLAKEQAIAPRAISDQTRRVEQRGDPARKGVRWASLKENPRPT